MDVVNKSLIDISECIKLIINRDKESSIDFIEILDNFLETFDERLIDDMLDELMSVKLLKTTNDLSKIEFLSKKISYENNTIKCDKKIKAGGYGDITRCIFNDKKAIIKNPQYKKSMEKKFRRFNTTNHKFLKENIIHFILFCFHDKMIKCLNKQIYNCIPQIFNIIKTKNKIDDTSIVCTVMEQLDYDIRAFLKKSHSFKKELAIISLVAYNIYTLQTCFKHFVHGDMHSKNVMLQKLSNYVKYNIKTEKVDLSIECEYKTFIIDFGFASIDFDSLKCKNINMPYSKIFAKDDIHSNFNKGQDMRLFLASILYWDDMQISKELKQWLEILFKPYQTQDFLNLKKKGQPTFYFYEKTINNDDVNFYPENILLFAKFNLEKL